MQNYLGPVIEIRRFPEGTLTHEMFAFGSEIAVVPVSTDGESNQSSPIRRLASEELRRLIRGFTGVRDIMFNSLENQMQMCLLMRLQLVQ